MAAVPLDVSQYGVSRNPKHDRGKLVFASNFDLLEFKVDGEAVPPSEVIGAYPNHNLVVRFVRDDDGDVAIDQFGEPQYTTMFGKIEIIGEAMGYTCGCSLDDYRLVRDWWNIKLDDA